MPKVKDDKLGTIHYADEKSVFIDDRFNFVDYNLKT